eukprot:549541-Alexandrium_andersonii.AAC.1
MEADRQRRARAARFNAFVARALPRIRDGKIGGRKLRLAWPSPCRTTPCAGCGAATPATFRGRASDPSGGRRAGGACLRAPTWATWNAPDRAEQL